MLVFAQARLVLLSVPKTGSTALEAALERDADLVLRNPPHLKHMNLRGWQNRLAPLFDGKAAEFRTIAVIRDPVDRLRAIVGVHVGQHTKAPRESLLGNSELRSLEPQHYAVVVTKRDVQRRMFDRVVVDGVDRGVFTTKTPVDTARFIVSACTAVAGWFHPDGPLTAQEVTARYQDIALDAVGYRKDP